MMFERVLVGLDNSEHARRALAAAGELAKLSGAEVRVLNIREGLATFGRGGPIEPESEDTAKALVDGAVRELEQSGLQATGTVRATLSGAVAGDIVDEARSWGASVIVLASRGMTDLQGILVGSTTHKVLHLCDIPVLVVR
jgi:nucleotide-binding universal stress UspA family protein